MDPGTADRAFDLIDRSIGDDGPQTRAAAARAPRARRDPQPASARWSISSSAPHPGPDRPRAMVGRQHAFALVATGCPPPRRRPATSPWPSWPGATWPGTARPTERTSRGGRACRCATPAPGWARSPASCAELPGGLLDLAGRGGPRGCRAPPARRLRPLLLGWRSRARTCWATTSPRRQRRRVPQLCARRRPGGRGVAPVRGRSQRRARAVRRPRRPAAGGAGARRRGAAVGSSAWPPKHALNTNS